MKDTKKKILILRLGATGDVVHTTIIASAIKQKHPDWEVHYLTQSEIAPILENHPHIDKVITWNRTNRKSNKQLLDTGLKLFKERYDIVFNLTTAIRNILLSILAMPRKIVHRKHLDGSWIEDYFQTAKSVIPDIEIPKRLFLGTDDDTLAKIKNDLQDKPKPHIVIIPGGGTDKNRQGRIWNIEKYKELINKLLQEYGGTIIVSGGKSERNYHQALQRENVIILTGEYSLKESSHLYSLADLMISGDTGPLHIASAHNTKTIAILGSTSPDKIKPYGENGYFIEPVSDCKYCWGKKCPYLKDNEQYTPCTESITHDMVINKIKENKLL